MFLTPHRALKGVPCWGRTVTTAQFVAAYPTCMPLTVTRATAAVNDCCALPVPLCDRHHAFPPVLRRSCRCGCCNRCSGCICCTSYDVLPCLLAGHVLLKYVDKDGDLVTITCRSDVQTALAEALKAMDRRLGVIPPIKIACVPVADAVRV